MSAALTCLLQRGSARKEAVISREVGGRFMVPSRNGVQLLLIPDVKVVQKSCVLCFDLEGGDKFLLTCEQDVCGLARRVAALDRRLRDEGI